MTAAIWFLHVLRAVVPGKWCGVRRGVETIEPRGWDSYPVTVVGTARGEHSFGGLIPKHERPFGVKGFFEQVFATNACSC
jgi:hypothetical protein